MAAPSRVSGRDAGDRSSNLRHLQLPSGNLRVVRDDPLLSKHAAQPVRPQTTRRLSGKPADSFVSPRQKIPSSPVSAKPLAVAATSPLQCKSARANLSRLAIPDANELESQKTHQRPASSPVARDHEGRLVYEPPQAASSRDFDPQFLFPINTRAREHVEIKACLLAHTHRLDVDELQRIRGNNQLALNRFKMQRIISRGGAFSADGSAHEEAKRKTTFLLRHFFTLQDSSPSPQDQLLCDIVDDWACGDHATSDDISRLWKSINDHIEKSYLLRRKLVAKADPDELSVLIAMDCLRKLPQRLPEYQRVLDVIITVIESGLYLNNSVDTLVPASQDPSREDDDLPRERKLLYFEAFWALENIANAEQTQQPCSGRASLKNYPWQDKHNDLSFRQRIEALINQLDVDEDKKELFELFLRGNISLLAGSACEEVLKYHLETEIPERADALFELLMQRTNASDIARLLTAIARAHSIELQKFALGNIDTLLGENSSPPGTMTEKSAPALFQHLVDRHPQEFAAILWRSPYLTAHIFQGSENLVARVLEQNVYRVSQVLTQRSDVLLPLLSHTFRESTSVLEEFLINHPRGLADLLLNRSSAIAAVVKAKPYILSDVLQACNVTLTKVLASSPEIVSSVIKSNPQTLPQIVREDTTILNAVFATVPQCLGDTLEKHPEFFVDVAHRKPALISRLFAEHPDLLLEPFEANPALFTTFLLYHRNVLPDFNDPDFDPTVFKLTTKTVVETGVQTSSKLNQGRRKLRAREKLRRQCEELLEPLRAMTEKEVTLSTTITQTTGGSEPKTEEELLTEENWTTYQIVNEIGRIYIAKIAADEHDDAMNRKRQSLADFVMELYMLELGLKPLAKRKLVNLLLAAKQVVGVPEATRVKWFRRFMNAIPGDRPLPQTALDFYLLALQHVIPGGQLALRLEAAYFQSCTVSQSVLKALVDDPLVGRLFDSKEQRQRMLAFQSISVPSRQDAGATVARSSMTMLSMLGLDDVLDMVMKVWMQYQLRTRDEWAMIFQEIIPDATGVAHFDAFATMVRSKFPGLDNRELVKIYNSCGDENEHGEFTLFSEDFTFTMSILQERHILRQYTTSSSSTTSSVQLLSPFATPPATSRH
ncbi:Sodium/hydrogen exchanger [Phytophthora cinnamomi]|uniref:Sodium/hydrogen exchanger n=1 Tax=Phytophthora cinnamomi TaxID=4785 RepID=UPI003559C476|nr:Sodium/hydrogen exchanger [Phytophthora cinnamomi]